MTTNARETKEETMDLTEKIERAIVTALVEECSKDGYVPTDVWDGEEYVPATDVRAVLDAVFEAPTSTIHFARTGDAEPRNLGVLIVCGNGEDCISDWHCGDPKFNAAVERASKRSENLSVTA